MLDESSSAAAVQAPRHAPVHVPVTGPLPPTPLKPADLLTQILLGLRLEGVEYGRCLLRAPWAVAFPARAEARFHFVARGGCWLKTAGSAEWERLNAGDAVLLPRGSAHVLASAPDLPTVEIDSLSRRAVADDIYLVGAEAAAKAMPSAEPVDVMFCGAMRFNLDPLHPLLAMMPDAMRANDLARRDPTVPALLEAMEREVAMDRIGACGILARMADVLAASIIRAWVECACNDASGWIAAVQCPSIGKVIAAIHAEPERDWARHVLRILEIIDNQVRSLRKRQVIEAFTRGERKGAYWGIRTNVADYGLTDALPCPFDRTTELANTPTRLARLEAEHQERLINWGYAVCDAALRRHVDRAIKRPLGFPYAGAGV